MFGDKRASAEEDKFAFCVTSTFSGFRDNENGDAHAHVQLPYSGLL